MQNREIRLHPHEVVYHLILITVGTFLLTGTVPSTDPARRVPSPQPGPLVINEILYQPPASRAEFIELYNRSDDPLDLRTIRIADSRRRPVPIDGNRTVLEPGEFAVIVQDQEAFHHHSPELNVYTADLWPQLNNGGDTVLLFSEEVLLDSVQYRHSWGGNTVSLERVDPAGPSSDKINWRPSTASSGSTPGRHNSVYAPDTTAPRVIFAEETSARTIVLYFNEPVASSSTTSGRFSCGDEPTVVDARLRADPRQIQLTLSVPPRTFECTVDRVEDIIGNVMAPSTLPLAYLPGPGDLALTELMYQPLADPFDGQPDQPEYFELYNRSENHLTAHGIYWTDQPKENQVADTTRAGSSLEAIPPNGYAVVFADPEATAGEILRRAFPGPSAPVRLLPVPQSTLGLRNDGEMIRIHGSNDTVVDELYYRPEWHHPDLIERQGIALERIAIDGPSNEGSNWSSSTAPSGGTPGRPNTLTTPSAGRLPQQTVRIDPSPFSPDGDGYEDHTLIEYRLSRATASLRLRIFDVEGRLVRRLLEARLSASTGTVVWDGRDDRTRPVPSGIYIVLLEAVHASGGTVERFKTPVVVARSL